MLQSDERARRCLEAVLAMGRILTATSPYERVVAGMMATVSDVLDIETCGFFLHDPDRDELVLQRPGFNSDDDDVFAFFHIPLSRPGPTRQVFLTHRPTFVNNALEDPDSPWFHGAQVARSRTILVVPLVVEGRGIGVLSLMNKRAGPFNTDDVELAMQMAPHLALAIDAAAQHEKLQEQQRQLDRALQVHTELSKALVNAPEVGPVTTSLGQFLKRPVILLDAGLRLLASTELPELGRSRAEVEAALRQAFVDVLEPQPGSAIIRSQLELADRSIDFVATLVSAGERVEGYLAVLEVERPLDVVDMRALEHAATLVAFQMLRQRTALDVERRLRGEVFQELLSATRDTERGALPLLERLGASANGPWRVARLELLVTQPTGNPTSVAYDPQAGALLSAALAEAGVSAQLVPWRHGFACVLPDDAGSGWSSKLAERLQRGLSRSPDSAVSEVQYALALGASVVSPRDLGRSLDQAEDALALARRLQLLDRVVRFEDLMVERMLLESMDTSSTHVAFVEQVLGRLIGYDEAHNRELMSTLRVYVAADYAPRVVALRLFIHVNTVHFRIRCIADLVGKGWPHGEQRFRVELALRVMDLADLRERQLAHERHTPV